MPVPSVRTYPPLPSILLYLEIPSPSLSPSHAHRLCRGPFYTNRDFPSKPYDLIVWRYAKTFPANSLNRSTVHKKQVCIVQPPRLCGMNRSRMQQTAYNNVGRGRTQTKLKVNVLECYNFILNHVEGAWYKEGSIVPSPMQQLRMITCRKQ